MHEREKRGRAEMSVCLLHSSVLDRPTSLRKTKRRRRRPRLQWEPGWEDGDEEDCEEGFEDIESLESLVFRGIRDTLFWEEEVCDLRTTLLLPQRHHHAHLLPSIIFVYSVSAVRITWRNPSGKLISLTVDTSSSSDSRRDSRWWWWGCL